MNQIGAIYERRRVGKTFLVQNIFNERLAREFTGTRHASLKEQLENFSPVLTRASESLPPAKPANRMRAFAVLTDYLNPLGNNPVPAKPCS